MKLPRPYPVLIFAACAAAMIGLRFAAPGPRAHAYAAELRTIGLLLMSVAGSVIALAGGLFRKQNTPVMPFKIPNRLVTTGPYARSRNPMYLMLAVALAGLALWLHSTTPPLVIPVFVWAMTALVIQPEERRLEAAFGDEYRSYCRRVRRWI